MPKLETTKRRHQIVHDLYSKLIGKKDRNGIQLYSEEKIMHELYLRTGYQKSYLEKILCGHA